MIDQSEHLSAERGLKPIKALTIHEPYASLLAGGFKAYETRSWPTHYRGPIAIHAGRDTRALEGLLSLLAMARRSMTCDVYRPGTFAYEASECLFPCPPYYLSRQTPKLSHFSLGTVIAVGQLVAVHRVETLTLSDREQLFGNYAPGRYAWEIRDVKPLERPVYARGQQGLWNWTRESEATK